MTASKLALEIDLDEAAVGELVRAQLAPTIERELAKLDVERLIRDKLTAPGPRRSGLFVPMFGADIGFHESLLDDLISATVRNEAKAFIDRTMRNNRAALEKSFTAMMRGSEEKLTRAFCDAMLGAVVSGKWIFDLGVSVTADTAERDDD